MTKGKSACEGSAMRVNKGRSSIKRVKVTAQKLVQQMEDVVEERTTYAPIRWPSSMEETMEAISSDTSE